MRQFVEREKEARICECQNVPGGERRTDNAQEGAEYCGQLRDLSDDCVRRLGLHRCLISNLKSVNIS